MPQTLSLILAAFIAIQCLPEKKQSDSTFLEGGAAPLQTELSTLCSVRDGMMLSFREAGDQSSNRLAILEAKTEVMCKKPEKEGYIQCQHGDQIGYLYCKHEWLSCCEGIGETTAVEPLVINRPLNVTDTPVINMPITSCRVANIHHYIFGLKNQRFDTPPNKEEGNHGNRKYFYELEAGGGQAMQMRPVTVNGQTRYWQIKNGQYEEMWEENGFVYRAFDTSPGKNDDGKFQTYIQQDILSISNGQRVLAEGARWIPTSRSSTDGAWSSPYTHTVTFFINENCGEQAGQGIAYQYTHTNKMNLKGCIEDYAYKSKSGRIVQLGRVIVLNSDDEHYYYAQNYGLVGWHANWEGSGYITEDLTFEGDLDFPQTTTCQRPTQAKAN